MTDGDIRPVPDPTILTTAQLHREVDNLDEKLDAKVEGRHAEQAAMTMLQDAKNEALKEIMEARFAMIDRQFEQVERNRIEQKSDTKSAVDAALVAQRDAVNKAETAATKQSDALSARVDDLSTRVTAMESARQGGVDMRVLIFATIGLAVTIFTVLAANRII